MTLEMLIFVFAVLAVALIVWRVTASESPKPPSGGKLPNDDDDGQNG